MSRLCCVFLCALLLVVGCNQPTKTVSPQVADQQTVTPTTTAQDQMTAGSDVNVYVINAPGASGLPREDDPDTDEDESAPWVTAEGVQVGKTNAGYVQTVTLNINTGSTTPTATGSATGTGTADQTPTQSTTASPVQDVKPEFTTAVPIAVGLPGSAVNSSGNAAGSGGQLSNPSNDATQTPTWTQLKVPTNYAADAIAFLKEFLAMKAAGKQPVLTSQPG